MYIKKVELVNFRNYDKKIVEFNKDINVIYGNNAVGKTNILEAIYLTSYGQSFRANKDIEILKFEQEYANIIITFYKNGRMQEMSFAYDKGKNKKIFKLNDIILKRVSDVFGKINTVIFKPDDIDLINRGPDIRRKYIDNFIGTLSSTYIRSLYNYHKLLNDRNIFLKENVQKYLTDRNSVDLINLEILNEQLSTYAQEIVDFRKKYISKLSEKAKEIHKLNCICGLENLKIEYIPNIKDKNDFLEKLKRREKDDFIRGSTYFGVQRDNIDLKINGNSLCNYGSQGQKKSSILSLKIAELNIFKEELNDDPVFLLDDLMSELDSFRRINFINSLENIQVIITSTEKKEFNDRENTFIEIT